MYNNSEVPNSKEKCPSRQSINGMIKSMTYNGIEITEIIHENLFFNKMNPKDNYFGPLDKAMLILWLSLNTFIYL